MYAFSKEEEETDCASVMRNNRIEQFSNEKNNSMKNRKIEHNDSCDSVHSRRSTSTRCQIFVANELNRVDNRMEMHKMNGWLGRRNQQEIGKNSLLIDGKINDLATDGYVTAEDDSAGEETKSNVPNTSTSFLRQKYPAHKYKVHMNAMCIILSCWSCTDECAFV